MVVRGEVTVTLLSGKSLTTTPGIGVQGGGAAASMTVRRAMPPVSVLP